MRRYDYIFLALLGLLVFATVATYERTPGYMDADYYYATGKQLASGKGFTEPFLWNYLDDPGGLPHPSHAYWMPLSSMMAAMLPALFRAGSWVAAQLPFLLVAACIPPLTAALAYSLTSKRSPAMFSGLLGVFSGFYVPFLTTTDTFGLYMLLGGLFFLVIQRSLKKQGHSLAATFLLGLLAGLMHLSRADGLLWLVLALLASLLLCSSSPRRSLWRVALVFAVTVCGYLLIMAPWFLRNMSAFGSLLAPGGSKMLWLTSYDQIFSYPATSLTFAGWLDSGWKSILSARLWALGLNLANTLSVQGGIFLLPFILIGLWQVRKEKVIGLAIFAWLMTFAAMTVAFPFAGARGGFFHSGAALQVVWWAAAPLGLERIIQWGSKHRGWREAGARSVFAPGLVGLTVLFTILVLFLRLPNWNNEAAAYRQVDSFLQSEDATAGEVVVVSNPPGFYLASSRSAISVPDGTLETILELGERYDAAYLILEEGSTPAGLLSIYDSPAEVEGLSYLGEVEGARVYAIEP